MDFNRLDSALEELVQLVDRLRGPGGCPWDAKQTDSSIKNYLLEEAYEVADAIERSSSEEVCSELGDLLFQILFLSKLAHERKEFDLVDVMQKIREKMIRRHPHVFGKEKAESAREVALNWEKIKRREGGTERDKASLLEDIPINLPSLQRVHRITERAEKMGLMTGGKSESLGRLGRGIGLLERAAEGGDLESARKELGGMLFSLADLSRRLGLNSEEILRKETRAYLERMIKSWRGGRKKSHA